MKKSMRYVLSVLAVLTLAACKTSPEDSSVDGTAQAADLDTMRQKSYLELLLQGAAVPFVSLLDDGAVESVGLTPHGSIFALFSRCRVVKMLTEPSYAPLLPPCIGKKSSKIASKS